MSQGIKQSDVTLEECALEQSPSSFAIIYKVRNHSGRDLVVFNRIPTEDATSASGYFSNNNAYVDFDGATVFVRLMILPLDLPPGLSIEDHPTPYVTLLKAGAVFAERLVMTEPVRVQNPIRMISMHAMLQFGANPHGHIAAIKPARASALSFSVGLSAFSPEVKLLPALPEFPDVLAPVGLRGLQVVLTHDFRLSHPISVLDYGETN